MMVTTTAKESWIQQIIKEGVTTFKKQQSLPPTMGTKSEEQVMTMKVVIMHVGVTLLWQTHVRRDFGLPLCEEADVVTEL